MVWSERQQALLRAMGLRLWLPGAAAGLQVGEAVPAPVAGETAESPGGSSAEAARSSSAGVARPAEAAARRQVSVGDALSDPAPRPSARAVPPVPGATRSPATDDARPKERPLAPAASGEASAPTRVPAVALAPVSLDGVAADWAGLEAQVAACTACGLCEGRRQTVFGVGDHRARLMVIGEAPGEQEDRQGEPFVGPAGQLLDRMLDAIGHRRGEGEPPRVYIANTLKCRPPGNRNPTPEELAHCTPYLWRQIELVRPTLILALGAFAVRAVLRQEAPAIGRLRGRVHDVPRPGAAADAADRLPVVVSYHPSYLLRQPGEKAKAWADLCLAMDVLERQAASAESAAAGR